MKNVILLALVVCFLQGYGAQNEKKSERKKAEKGWVKLFNGKNLKDWKFSEDEGTFSVKDGAIMVHGKRSH